MSTTKTTDPQSRKITDALGTETTDALGTKVTDALGIETTDASVPETPHAPITNASHMRPLTTPYTTVFQYLTYNHKQKQPSTPSPPYVQS